MNQIPEVKARTEVRDCMRITWHEPIEMDDGNILRADVFRPIQDGRYPTILTYGVYAKGLSYQEGYPHQWQKMVEAGTNPPAPDWTKSFRRSSRRSPTRSCCRPSWTPSPPEDHPLGVEPLQL